MKLDWKPGTLLYPLPAVLVSCAHNGRDNLLTVAWTGTVCTDPPMLYISVRPGRFSYSLIAESGEFTVNLTTAAMARATDLCGVISGADTDKWQASGLHRAPGHAVGCPAVEESPLSLECKVEKVLELGTHHMFLALVKAIQVEDGLMDETGRFCFERAKPLAYSHGAYCGLTEAVGSFGYSIRKKSTGVKKKQKKTFRKQG